MEAAYKYKEYNNNEWKQSVTEEASQVLPKETSTQKACEPNTPFNEESRRNEKVKKKKKEEKRTKIKWGV